ncbi:MAG: hypothetical protein FJ316_04840 [SAR202 cluster bacterium]|nr:hypothetical protein [SAR202 cluster bacterium]
MRMLNMADVLNVIQPHRGNSIVVPGRAGRHWVKISTKPTRDVPLGDPAMGGHASFAFGLALAQPKEKVVIFDSEGDILMNLGALPTIAELAPKNFYHILLDNEVYGTTGGQPVPNSKVNEYDVMAKACGYPHTYRFDDLEEFSNQVGEILHTDGPVFIWIKVRPEIENLPINQRVRWNTRPRDQVLRDVKKEMGVRA